MSCLKHNLIGIVALSLTIILCSASGKASTVSDMLIVDGIPISLNEGSESTNNSVSITVTTAQSLSFTGVAWVGTPGQVVLLTEPGSGGQTWSDLVYFPFDSSNGHTVFLLSNVGATGLPHDAPAPGVNNFVGVLDETGSLQDLSAFFGLPTGAVVVQSNPDLTPLPAALPLFAGGLGALGLLGWRRKRKTIAAA